MHRSGIPMRGCRRPQCTITREWKMKLLRTSAIAAAGLSALLMTGCGSVNDGPAAGAAASLAGDKKASDMTMVTVVKLKGIAWFDRMDVGVREYGKRTGIDTRTEGGDDVSPEKQIKIIQDLVAQKPTAITV